uniref:DUF3989 domain-containing protein n=1 Tax=Strongyloides stercoralis TaxID=6248 RepID=A0A0K0EHK7_STRER
MILWEWRRLYRQGIRKFFSNTNSTYKSAGRKKLLVGFILFVVGWKIGGLVLYDKISNRLDDESGEERYFEIREPKNQFNIFKSKEDSDSTANNNEEVDPKTFKLDTDD